MVPFGGCRREPAEMMIRYRDLLITLFVLISIPVSGIPGPAERPSTIVEISPPLPPPPPGVLSTVGYSPTEKEKPFLEKVTEKSRGDLYWTDETEISLAAAEGKYVGWFGIVREITRLSPAGPTRLLIEHKYFDGLTDSHLQVVSYYGAGDFIALLYGDGFEIPLFDLVRVYGTVEMGTDGLPEVRADYIRVWDWGRFTFMTYGKDKSNPRWVKLRRVPGPDAYSSRPTRRFYENRLGPRPGGSSPLPPPRAQERPAVAPTIIPPEAAPATDGEMTGEEPSAD